MSDIARQAKCHRTTVHRHYSDKDSLVLACFETAVEAVKDGLTYPQETSGKSASQIAYANILAFYTHVSNNQALYRALFTSSAGGSIRSRFRRFAAGASLSVMLQEGALEDMAAPNNIVGNLLGDMFVGAIIWCICSNKCKSNEIVHNECPYA